MLNSCQTCWGRLFETLYTHKWEGKPCEYPAHCNRLHDTGLVYSDYRPTAQVHHIYVNQADTQWNQRKRMHVQMSWMSTRNKISVTKWIAQQNNVPIMIWSNTMFQLVTVLCQACPAMLCSVNHRDSIVTVCRLFSSCTWNLSEVNITLLYFCESIPFGWGFKWDAGANSVPLPPLYSKNQRLYVKVLYNFSEDLLNPSKKKHC